MDEARSQKRTECFACASVCEAYYSRVVLCSRHVFIKKKAFKCTVRLDFFKLPGASYILRHVVVLVRKGMILKPRTQMVARFGQD